MAKKSCRIMEVCGTHTMSIARCGLRHSFPEGVTMLSGPGCPVCVTPMEEIDAALRLASETGVTVATFGDMVRVPGSATSLEKERGNGADVRIVYSPMDALELAAAQPRREVVFLGVGFETTAPAVAATVVAAKKRNLKNFSVLPMFRTVPGALRAILESDNRIDGFLLPGHVSAIIGLAPYGFIAREFKTPGVVAGFEPDDILAAVDDLVALHDSGRAEIGNRYERVVRPEGNPTARRLLDEVFESYDARWRAIGVIPGSGLTFNGKFKDFNAAAKFALKSIPAKEPAGCKCGEILLGRRLPRQCGLFGKRCTPRDPVGPCMVSSEGSCAAEYKYGSTMEMQ